MARRTLGEVYTKQCIWQGLNQEPHFFQTANPRKDYCSLSHSHLASKQRYRELAYLKRGFETRYPQLFVGGREIDPGPKLQKLSPQPLVAVAKVDVRLMEPSRVPVFREGDQCETWLDWL